MLDDKDIRDRDLNNNRDLNENREEVDLNKDPLSGAHGSHPVGTGVGGVGGAAAGAAIGAVAGPLGSLVGGAIGAVAGGLVGKGVAEGIDPTVEEGYWRDNYSTRPYVGSSNDYSYEDDYLPAYKYGWENRSKYQDRSFDDADSELGTGWDRNKGNSRLGWDEAKHATKDAWHRVERAIPGDADNDGR